MLRVIAPLFEQNDIRYSICGGTLLGAYTTGRFIPWDDDIDICVLDEDYEKAIRCIRQSIPEWMCVQWTDTESRYFHAWAKIRDRNSHVYPDTSIYSENGVWIDLYRLIPAREAEVPYLVAREHMDYLTRRLEAGDISSEERDRRVSQHNLLERINESKAHAEQCGDSKRVYVIWSASKIVVDEKCCFPLRKYTFEGLQLSGFNDAEEYLLRHYGENFRTLPPDDLRRIGINSIRLRR